MIANTPDLTPICLGYSLKNIPPSKKEQYMVKMYQMADKLVRKMRWKAFHLNLEEQEFVSKEYGGIFPTHRNPKEDKHLERFENDLYNLIKSLKFRKVKNPLFLRMRKDLNEIRKTNKFFAFADKSLNMYKIKPELYKKLLEEQVTATYKKSNNKTVEIINNEAQIIINNLKIPGKVPKLQKQEAFITLKDHKKEFPNKIKCRLIIPTKTNVAKVAKRILDKLINRMKSVMKLNQWKHTHSVINWFNSINDKSKHRFIKFDVIDFYPSISNKTLVEALNLAKNYCKISENEIETVTHCCKSILIYNNSAWTKKNTDDGFDVPQGSFHGAEVCELVGLLLLHAIEKENIFERNKFGIFRDDGISVVKSKSGPYIERISKKLRKVFSKFDLKITIESNLTKTDFLDVELDLINDSYAPFRKPNFQATYVSAKSNHPRYVVNQIPKSINKRLTTISKDEYSFKRAKEHYQEALIKGGHKHELVFNAEKSKGNKRKRKNILYFTPPFCITVETNIGKRFLEIVSRNFDSTHPYHKIFNRKLLKLSYSCMPNMKSQIMSHNRKMLEEKRTDIKLCNCREECVVDGKCLLQNVIYKATVKTAEETKQYVGSSGLTFKSRYTRHKCSFNNYKYRFKTTLSKYIWELKDKNLDFNIKWEILARTKNKFNLKNGCTLCNMEKKRNCKT